MPHFTDAGTLLIFTRVLLRRTRSFSPAALTGETYPRRQIMVKLALFVRLEAKPGKEKEVEHFLVGGLPFVMDEPGTTAWLGFRLGPSTFGIFAAFPDELGRQEHLSSKVAATLMAKAGELFSQPPAIEKTDILAAKLPGHALMP
jgi:quinol monooxygenase YgiN